MLFYSITAWLPPIVQNMGYSKQYAGNMLTIFSIIQIPVCLVLPVLLKRLPSRRLWLLLGSSLLLAGFLLLAFGVRPWLAAVLIGIGPGVLFPINLLLPIDEAADAQQAAAWSAMTQSIGYMIGAFGPVLLGAVHDAAGGSFVSLILAMLGIIVLMLAVHLAVARGRRAKTLAAARA
jgi:CP family cyanate transporter-like MFS transporter